MKTRPMFRRFRPAILSMVPLLAAFAPQPASAQIIRRIVSDNGDPILYPSHLTEYDGQLFFRANNLEHGNNVELWAFDGIVARLAAEVRPGTSGSNPVDLTVCNNTLYFGADDGNGNKLWQYDNSTGLALAAPGSSSLAKLPQSLFAHDGDLYFRATRFSDIGIELWKFDGASQAPIDLYPGTGSSYPQHFIEYDGLMYFNANGTPGQGTELWRHDGTGMPEEAARIYPGSGSSPENFAVYDGKLYFSARNDDPVTGTGRELWCYDGSTATLAADIVPGGPYSSSNPSGLTVFEGKLYFSADDAVHGYELWSFDGSDAEMVAEINPTPDPGNGDTWEMDSSPGDFTVFNGVLYFAANDGSRGRELWSYDGTTASLVMDINPGQYGSELSELTVFNGALYFSADDGFIPGLGSLQPAVFALAMAPVNPLRLAIQAGTPGGDFVINLTNSDGSPVTPEQAAAIRVFKSPDPTLPFAQWQPLPEPPAPVGGAAQIQDSDISGLPRCFYRAVREP